MNESHHERPCLALTASPSEEVYRGFSVIYRVVGYTWAMFGLGWGNIGA